MIDLIECGICHYYPTDFYEHWNTFHWPVLRGETTQK
jgi:hypothetical protein